MACETDSYTKRPRGPNDPYTAMTEEQIRNIKHVCFECTCICHIQSLLWHTVCKV